MTSIPSNFSRVPNRLVSSLTRDGLMRSNLSLLQQQVQLSSSKRVSRPSEDPIAAAVINVLEGRLAHAEQRERNLSHAEGVLGSLDEALGQIVEAAQEAKTVASSQIGVGSDASTRASQAVVIDSLIKSVFNSANGDYAGVFFMGGERSGARPLTEFFGGYRYSGEGSGLYTDLGSGLGFPITIGADRAIGALRAEQGGTVDLNPTATATTRVQDLRGPAGEIEALGSLRVDVDDGTPPPVALDVDLSAAQTLGDVVTAIESALRAGAPGSLGGGAPTLGLSGERLSIGGITPGTTITFSDGASGQTATALGLAGHNFTSAAPVFGAGPVLNPKLSDRVTLGSLAPTSALTYGPIVFRNGGRSGTVTTNAAMTVGQLKEAVDRLGLGIRVEISASGDSIDIVNEVSGFKMSVEEGGGAGASAAATLGIRTLDLITDPKVLNHGKGVRISDGNIRPDTGMPDVERNRDFQITLTDGSSFTVDLRPQDMVSMQSLLNRINAEAGALSAVFDASLDAAGTGIQLRDTAGGGQTLRVTSLNGSAAQDLGLLDANLTSGPTTILQGSNRGTVRVDSLLSSLIELRGALEGNDPIGIEFAGERLETDLLTGLQARAEVGARAGRISGAQDRLVDTTLLDRSIKSDLQDLDYIEASSRFALLQTQLQAGLQTAATVNSLTLLNFLR